MNSNRISGPEIAAAWRAIRSRYRYLDSTARRVYVTCLRLERVPSARALAKHIESSPRRVEIALAELEAAGLIPASTEPTQDAGHALHLAA